MSKISSQGFTFKYIERKVDDERYEDGVSIIVATNGTVTYENWVGCAERYYDKAEKLAEKLNSLKPELNLQHWRLV